MRYLRVIWRAGPLSCGTAPQQWALPYFITDQQSGTTNITPTPREASVTSQQKRQGTGVTLPLRLGLAGGKGLCQRHAPRTQLLLSSVVGVGAELGLGHGLGLGLTPGTGSRSTSDRCPLGEAALSSVAELFGCHTSSMVA